jgi:two-component system chemotaxis response regulator CheB
MINTERIRRNVITIGTSAGGVEALRCLFSLLPGDVPAAIALVLHRSPVFESRLPLVLGRRTRLRVVEPADGEPFKPGSIYVAPRDQHMLLENGVLRLHRGPKEHGTRPAIDPLFRSAAEAYGERVVGVLLSGLGDDGVPGLVEIKKAGGLSIVQDPEAAPRPSMPCAAIRDDDVDAVLKVHDLAAAIVDLAKGEVVDLKPPEARAAS